MLFCVSAVFLTSDNDQLGWAEPLSERWTKKAYLARTCWYGVTGAECQQACRLLKGQVDERLVIASRR